MNPATSPVSDPAQVTQIFEGIETSLRQQRSAFEAAVGAVDSQLQLLREQVREHLEDTRAQQQISTLEAERAQLSEALKEQRAQREQLEHKLDEVREALTKEQAQVRELREELAERGGAADAARGVSDPDSAYLDNVRSMIRSICARLTGSNSARWCRCAPKTR